MTSDAVRAALELIDKARADLDELLTAGATGASPGDLLQNRLNSWADLYRRRIGDRLGSMALDTFNSAPGNAHTPSPLDYMASRYSMRGSPAAELDYYAAAATLESYRTALAAIRADVERHGDEYLTAGGVLHAASERALHPLIGDAAKALLRDGYHAQAVFEACKALVAGVRERSGSSLDGAKLTRTVFSVNDPVLAFNDLADQSDKDEQEGLMHLFEGAALAIRNPRGHDMLTDTRERALEYLGLLSLLAKRLDEAKKKK